MISTLAKSRETAVQPDYLTGHFDAASEESRESIIIETRLHERLLSLQMAQI